MIWGNSKKANLNNLTILQKRACRIILGDQYSTFKEAMKQINILSIHGRIFLQKAKFMFRVSRKTNPSYINNMFLSSGFSNINLRSSNSLNFVTPKPNIELFKESMSYSGTVLWNSILADIRMSDTINIFTAKCERWLRDNESSV